MPSLAVEWCFTKAIGDGLELVCAGGLVFDNRRLRFGHGRN